MSEPERQYQEYLRRDAIWKEERSEIVGSNNDSDTIKGIIGRIRAIRAIPDHLTKKKQDRKVMVDQIYSLKLRLLENYKRLYRPVQETIDKQPTKHGELEITASMTAGTFEEEFLSFIHQGKKGSFQGAEGRKRLRQTLRDADFNSPEGIHAFLGSITHLLRHDVRQAGDPRVSPGEQLLEHRSTQDIYNFLLGLKYLQPRLELRWQGKSLDQLSPGERGSLLLVFYLLVDNRDSPIIIDQPEENLDNQTVADLIVPAIKDATARRQVIIVTHNPNLAVVCDADQIVYTSIDKEDKNRISHMSGSLENPTIAQVVLDVLEGTRPAFDLRDSKYSLIDQ